MKLAQLLSIRADLQKHMKELKFRISKNSLVQEGEQPLEQPDDLLINFERTAEQWELVVNIINAINNSAIVKEGYVLSKMVIEREKYQLLYKAMSEAYDGLSPSVGRFSRSEIKQIPVMDGKILRKKCDSVAKKLRDIDVSIQMLNWAIDVDDKYLGDLKAYNII